MGKRLLSLCMVLILCLTLLPVTALAAAPDRQVIYVGNENVTSGGYWTTDSKGNVTAYTGEGTPTDNYIHYDADTNILTLHNATIREYVPSDTSTYVMGAGIGVFNQNDASKLTIKLEGSNAIKNVSTGIFVLAFESTGSSSLTITGDGSLDASGNLNGIMVQSNSGDATLTIQSADVTLTSNSGNGVTVQAGSADNQGHTATLTVNGGKLTASGDAGIEFNAGNPNYNITTELTVSGNALVDTRNGGIDVYGAGDVTPTVADDATTGGIVFDGDEGTVYGKVTLQKDLTIKSGQTLDIPSGASLTIDSGATLTVNGGELTGNIPTNGVVYKVTEVKLDKDSLSLEVGGTATLTATVQPTNATNQNVTWSSDDESVATVENGIVTAIKAGTATITVKTQDGEKTASCTVTVTAPYIPPNPSYVISVSQAQGGKVTASPAAAKKGDTVTLTVTPEEGYELASLTVTDFWGRDVALTEQAGGTYTFTMPASQVEIEAAFTQAQPPFTDVSEADWFYDEVQYVVDKGLMIGVSDTEFAPGANLTRAMLWTILARMDGETITGSTWAQDARAWAMANGVSDGTDANRAVTREELVTMLWRYVGQPESTGDLSGFADGDTVSGWAEEAMSWSVGAGLIQGDENGLTPTATAIRAQIAAVLMRFCEGVAG